MFFLRFLPILFLFLFILTRKIDVKVIKDEALLIKISFNIFALVLTEEKIKRKEIRKIPKVLRSLKGIFKSADYLISKSIVNVFKCNLLDADERGLPLLYNASFYVSAKVLFYYLSQNARKVNNYTNSIFKTDEMNGDSIDISIHFSLWHMIISALLLLYYIVKSNIKRALKMSDMSEIIKDSLEGIKGFADVEKVIGNAIITPGGVTIIPISKLNVGFIGGGIDYGQKKISHNQNFGGGSGSSISVTPIAFLVVTPDSNINIISLNDEKSASNQFLSLIEHSPEIIEKIKNILS